MEDKRLKDELLFQSAMSTAKRLLDAGMIDAEDYKKIHAHFLKKYEPIIGSLLPENELT